MINQSSVTLLLLASSTIPSLQGLRKDHKGNIENDPNKGPKLRPLCAANKAPNAALANVVAKILKAVGNNISEFVGAEVISTEQLKREFEIVNEKISSEWEQDCEIAEKLRKRRRPGNPTTKQERDEVVVFSMDVVALYPSILKDMAQDAVRKAIERCNLRWENVNVKLLVRHIATIYDIQTIERLGLSEVVPRPKPRTTFRSFVNHTKKSKQTNGDSQFFRVVRHPIEKEIVRLIGIIAANATTTCMSNHFFTIGGEICIQEDGGSISSDLTGEVARDYMLLWDEKLLQKCKTLGILFDLQSRYVDDMIFIMRAIGKGWRFDTVRGIMVFDGELYESCNLSPTMRTAKVISDIANSICPQIQVTLDTPECNTDGRLPVLDLKVWSDGKNVIHTFYKKAVSSKYTIMRRSAIAGSVKKSTLFQESLRRINNISQILPWSETVQHLSEFSFCMKISGYDKTDRWNTIKGSILRKEEMLRKVQSGEIESIYRGKSEFLRSKMEKEVSHPPCGF